MKKRRYTKATLLAATGALVFAASTLAAPRADIDKVWVTGAIHSFMITGPGNAKNATPLYIIAPVDPAHPLHPLADARTKGFGAHDHVIADPHPGSAYRTTCDLTLTVPGPKAKTGKNVLFRLTLTPAGRRPLLYAANLGHGMQMLTAAARITEAKKLGLARFVDTGTLLACTIEPRHA